MPSISSLPVEWLASGAFVAALGGLIKFAGWTWLLAGYDESTSPVPDEAIRDIAGNTILRIGIAVLGVGILATIAEIPPYVELAVGTVILLAVLRLLYRLNTWSASESS